MLASAIPQFDYFYRLGSLPGELGDNTDDLAVVMLSDSFKGKLLCALTSFGR